MVVGNPKYQFSYNTNVNRHILTGLGVYYYIQFLLYLRVCQTSRTSWNSFATSATACGHCRPQRYLLRHLRPDSRLLKTELACLLGQLQPLADASSQPLLADLQHRLGLHNQLSNMPVQQVAEERLQDFEQRLAGDLAEDLHRLRDVSTPIPLLVTDLPPELRQHYIGRSGKWLLRVFAKDCLWDFEPLEHFTRQIATVDPEATGKPFSTVEGLRAMRDGFQRAGLYALLVIIAVLLADFRSLPQTLLALAPLAMGIVLSLGIMGLVGVPLNPANMIALPLILGVGVDNGVHVLHDFPIAPRGHDRRSVTRSAAVFW